MNQQVVKVGGSLFEWEALIPTLDRWLRDQSNGETLLVAGGGPFVDALRLLARRHDIDEERAHWLAIQAMALSGQVLATKLRAGSWAFADAMAFCRDDDALPHTWAVTSDSIAARIAEMRGADLVLLKSTHAPTGSVADWAEAGYVDRHFPVIVERAKLNIRAVNLRAY